jgi:predicted ester cyclase
MNMGVNDLNSITEQPPTNTASKQETGMSAQHNLDAFRQIIAEAFNQGNYEVLSQHFDPNFVEHQFGLHATIEGMQGDIQFLRTAFPDFNLTIEDLVTDGDKIWARMTARGTNLGGFMGPPNGKNFRAAVFDTVRFEGGKIVEHWGSPDRFAMLAQLGLLPQPQG